MSTNLYTVDELTERALSVQSRLLDLEHHGLDTARQQRTLDAIGYQLAQDHPSAVSGLLRQLNEQRAIAQRVHVGVDCTVCPAEDWRDSLVVEGVLA
ncbi:hypothetical protein [uncultured Friedmanniella sp.]|uniref:hypothetical protein n=1 Tax=uncultured Friedmanniella sp. TaxID=335381 RepID=UPI0035CB1749